MCYRLCLLILISIFTYRVQAVSNDILSKKLEEIFKILCDGKISDQKIIINFFL